MLERMTVNNNGSTTDQSAGSILGRAEYHVFDEDLGIIELLSAADNFEIISKNESEVSNDETDGSINYVNDVYVYPTNASSHNSIFSTDIDFDSLKSLIIEEASTRTDNNWFIVGENSDNAAETLDFPFLNELLYI